MHISIRIIADADAIGLLDKYRSVLPVDYDESMVAPVLHDFDGSAVNDELNISGMSIDAGIDDDGNEVVLINCDDIVQMPIPFVIVKPENIPSNGAAEAIGATAVETVSEHINDSSDEVELINWGDIIELPIPFVIVKSENVAPEDTEATSSVGELDDKVVEKIEPDFEFVSMSAIDKWPMPFRMVKNEQLHEDSNNGEANKNISNEQIKVFFDDEFSGDIGFVSATYELNGKKYTGRVYAMDEKKLFVSNNIVMELKKRSSEDNMNEGVDFLCILFMYFLRGKNGKLADGLVNPSVFHFIKFLYGRRIMKIGPTDLDNPATTAVFNSICREAMAKAKGIFAKKTEAN